MIWAAFKSLSAGACRAGRVRCTRLRRAGAVLVGACAVYAVYLCAGARLALVHERVECTEHARARIEQSRNARAVLPPAYAGREHVRHVVFSTARRTDILRRNIEKTVYGAWHNISAQIAFEVFAAHPPAARTHGPAVPDLPSMYTFAEALYPAALTYTFVNSDCVSNASFVATLEALLALGVPFYATGSRRSVQWTYTFPPVLADFDGLYKRGATGGDGHMDYFAVSRGALQWRDGMPPIRPGYPDVDTWLINYALHRPDVVVVDVTRTVPMLRLLGTVGANEGRRRPGYSETAEVAACEVALRRGQNDRYHYAGHTLSSAPMYSRYAGGADSIEIDHASGTRPVNINQVVAVGLKKLQ